MSRIRFAFYAAALAMASLACTASHAAKILIVPFEDGLATDFHLTFRDGKCTASRLQRLTPRFSAPDPEITSFGCNENGEAYFNIGYGNISSGVFLMYLDNIYDSEDPSLKDQKGGQIVIRNAWWTPGMEPMFPVGHNTVLALPEPDSWAMLIAGFGLIGIAARRQQRKRSTL